MPRARVPSATMSATRRWMIRNERKSCHCYPRRSAKRSPAGGPTAALLAATRRPAERLGKRELFGTIAPGRAADLLLLTADPLADIRNIRRIEQVIARGAVYGPDKLLRGLRAG